MGGVKYPIETETHEENGAKKVVFYCTLPGGNKKGFRVFYNTRVENDFLDNHSISAENELGNILEQELKLELFQEIYGVKIVDMWECFAKSSLIGDELRTEMNKDHIFKKFVEEFYPEYVKV